MSNAWLDYLKKEHARLEAEIGRKGRATSADAFEIARLKKMKLAINDQIVAWHKDLLHETAG
ncbi:hypothetical protein ACFB49_26890 [Sphingomonas sp. DBB INV C78]|uniref:YdcH family protein n=1 Tax=Sphingomonas sp. DBB INV C78 TaxID=3349434 RepID=UPI0036D3BD38